MNYGIMNFKKTHIVLILLFISIFPSIAEGVNIEENIESDPIASNINIIKVGDLSDVRLNEPLMIVGNNIDFIEKKTMDQLIPSLGIENIQTINDDSIREYEGKEIWEYDLIVIGGPAHNKVAEELLQNNYLILTSRQTNKPGFVMENGKGPLGNTFLLAGDVYGYEYDYKDLPIEKILPESQAAVAAIITSFLIGAGISVSGSSGGVDSSIFGKIKALFKILAEEVTEEKLIKKYKKKEEIIKKPFNIFGLTLKEIFLGIIAAGIFGLAYAWADFQMEFIRLLGAYIIAAGIALIIHEFVQNIVAYKYGADSEFKIWNLGVILVGITSYIFGNVFGLPGRNVTHSTKLSKKQEALIGLSGPFINIVFAGLFFLIKDYGGFVGQIATIAIPINLLLAVYDLMPFSPMDGKNIKDWNLFVWLIIFIPTFAVYFWNVL